MAVSEEYNLFLTTKDSDCDKMSATGRGDGAGRGGRGGKRLGHPDRGGQAKKARGGLQSRFTRDNTSGKVIDIGVDTPG